MTGNLDAWDVGYDIPAKIGMAVEDVETPALLIDLDAFEFNVARMKAYVEQKRIRLRAHAKTHKSADISLYQMRAGGASGMCCQKVSEAEALVRAGVKDILISNEVVGAAKVDRMARLALSARILVCVDDARSVWALGDACARHGSELEVLVEIDCGAGRCGVSSGEAAVAVAQQIVATPRLRFAGLQAYQGSAQHIADPRERQQAIVLAVEKTRHTVNLLHDVGLACEIIGGGGTGSHQFEASSGLYNELQCGSYVFMDGDYGRIRDVDGGVVGGFQQSLFVLSTVMSTARPGYAVCDAGLKAHSVDSGLPRVADLAEVEFLKASDEHGNLGDPGQVLSLGQKIRLIPGHCDPTCNLYDWFVGVRHGKVETLWPVTARGKLY